MDETKNPKPQDKAFAPTVHREFDELGNEHARLRVRVVQYRHPYFGMSEPRLDIRKWLENHKNRDETIYTGFTREGISLTWDDILALEALIPEIKEIMESIPEVERKKRKG